MVERRTGAQAVPAAKLAWTILEPLVEILPPDHLLSELCGPLIPENGHELQLGKLSDLLIHLLQTCPQTNN